MARGIARLPVFLSAALAAAVLGIVPAAAAPPPSTTCSVFPSNNIWNPDISKLPVHARSTQWLASMAASTTKLHPDFGGPPYGFPYNVVGNAHPTVTVSFQYASESDPGPYPVGADTLIENGSDRHALIVNRDTCTLYELYDLSGSGTSWTAGSGAIFPLGSNALRPLGWTSADAAGLPLFPGLVRWDEVQAGAVTAAHPLPAPPTARPSAPGGESLRCAAAIDAPPRLGRFGRPLPAQPWHLAAWRPGGYAEARLPVRIGMETPRSGRGERRRPDPLSSSRG